ncbi:cytochrome c oxidase assembly factor CtaG [Bacillus sp. 31A1R]|uniref:Cytochrome c oxidase assembly factor CtaG n=1 Tax=Robertmurraya mangrovi TaxID=3098077 RepID=A0ABU5IU26_9BACI|nr:cytochrome c oxidase assembly factor CtaG [Bacillus sp. 31A1R]MDZ5470657.1 cytochrome c oxidase assembly factor CtaG [Bacillus sp. 31A1R]
MLSLDIFGFKALWSPFFFLLLVAVLIGYFLLTVTYRNRFKHSEPLTRKEAIIFTITILLLYIVKGSPLDLMGHITFYAHMTQMAILYLVIPPLLIVGIPQWVWRTVLSKPVIKRVFNFLTMPLIALILFNGVFSIYHIPDVFDVIKVDMWLHAIYTSLIFILAICMWWPLVNTLEEYQTLSGLKKVGYIFADGILLTPACALIIFADTPMYATFSDPRAWMQALELCVSPSMLATLDLSGPEMFNSMSLLHDQQLGGVLMKIIQEIVYGYVLAQIFFSWYRKEQRDSEKVDKEALNQSNPQFVK